MAFRRVAAIVTMLSRAPLAHTIDTQSYFCNLVKGGTNPIAGNYGNRVTYMRIKGIVPPSSAQ